MNSPEPEENRKPRIRCDDIDAKNLPDVTNYKFIDIMIEGTIITSTNDFLNTLSVMMAPAVASTMMLLRMLLLGLKDSEKRPTKFSI